MPRPPGRQRDNGSETLAALKPHLKDEWNEDVDGVGECAKRVGRRLTISLGRVRSTDLISSRNLFPHLRAERLRWGFRAVRVSDPNVVRGFCRMGKQRVKACLRRRRVKPRCGHWRRRRQAGDAPLAPTVHLSLFTYHLLVVEAAGEEEDDGEGYGEGEGPGVVEVGPRGGWGDAGKGGGEEGLGAVGDEALHDA